MTQDNTTDATKPTERKPKMSRGWRAVLVASLALNLAVVGLVAGAAFRHKGSHAFSGKRGDPILMALDKQSRREIGRAMRKSRAGTPDLKQEINAAFADIQNALRAEVSGEYGVKGAFAGVPFPIPKTGVEVIWNHLDWNSC